MQGARILLVEDEEVLCDLIARNLRARQHEVQIAMTVRDALEQMRATRFDLIVLDINLPDKTGWDVLRAALNDGYIQPREIEGRATVPVIVLSAVRVSPSRLAEFHPLAYLPKPFPMDALLRFAAEAASRAHQEQLTHIEEETGA